MNSKNKKNILFLGYLTPILIEAFKKSNINIIGVGIETNNQNSKNIIKFCRSKNIFLFDAKNINKNIYFKDLAKKTDVVIVAAFSQLIDMSISSKIKYGIINFHPSLLPKYKGGSPLEEQILNGEKNGGITFHWMKEKFDDGPIVIQKKMIINEIDDYKMLLTKCVNLGAKTLKELLDKDIGKWKSLKPRGKETRFLAKKKYDACINFNAEFKEIEKIFKAFGWRKWPHIKFKGKNFAVDYIKKFSKSNKGVNGEVLSITPKIVVKCSNCSIEIKSNYLKKYINIGDIL